MTPPAIIAHGAGNTVTSTSAAIQAAADYVEIDLWLHRGDFEARHERRFPLHIPLLYEKWYLSRIRPATLDALLTASGTDTGIFLDIKSGGAGAARLVADAQMAVPDARLVASGQSWATLRKIATAAPTVDVFYSVDVAAKLDLLLSVIRRDRWPRGTSCRHSLLTRAIVERLHDAGLAVVAWTVDDYDRARELAAWGVDGITTHRVAEVRQALASPVNPLAVYVHIPFCTVKCGYCDFNAYAGMHGLIPVYETALLREIASWSGTLGTSEVRSIAFGGGTPGEFPADGIAAVIAAIRQRAGSLPPDIEVGLEANPGTTTLPYLEALRAAGVTRLSLGAQSFDATELRFLDRIHSPEATATSLNLVRQAGFASVNLDLMYGLPGQSLPGWQRTVETALALEPDHLSCYALTVEEGTPLARRVRQGEVPSPDGDLAATMFEWTRERLAQAGFEHYELSNWARPGHESRHNRVYWTGGDYLGLGAGAHGYLAGERYENIADPRAYVRSLDVPSASRPAVAHAYRPERPIAIFDWLETHFRLIAGFSEAEFLQAFGQSLDDVVGNALARPLTAGLVERAAGTVRLTLRGELLHSEVCTEILVGLMAQPVS